MSFNFNNNINPMKAQAAYKDGGGMGGGGMYMRQGKKRKEQPEEDLFQTSDDKDSNELDIIDNVEIKDGDIPQDNMFNKFVNWFRIQNNG